MQSHLWFYCGTANSVKNKTIRKVQSYQLLFASKVTTVSLMSVTAKPKEYLKQSLKTSSLELRIEYWIKIQYLELRMEYWIKIQYKMKIRYSKWQSTNPQGSV